MGGHTDRIREDGFVVKDILSPVHESVDILGRGKLRGALVAHAVFPEIFVSDFGPRAGGHDRALRDAAIFREGSRTEKIGKKDGPPEECKTPSLCRRAC